jgi:hypothetical protein
MYPVTNGQGRRYLNPFRTTFTEELPANCSRLMNKRQDKILDGKSTLPTASFLHDNLYFSQLTFILHNKTEDSPRSTVQLNVIVSNATPKVNSKLRYFGRSLWGKYWLLHVRLFIISHVRIMKRIEQAIMGTLSYPALLIQYSSFPLFSFFN